MKFKQSILLLLMVLTSNMVNAQSNLANILGMGNNSSTSALQGSSSDISSLISGIASIFSKDKQVSENSIVGTWVYSEPAILFQSDNVLTQVGAKLTAEKIEKTLKTKLAVYGIKEGAMSFTFNEDGTFTEMLSQKKLTGKWAIKDGQLQLTYGTYRTKTISITTQLENNQMMFVTDASKLLEMFKRMSGKSTYTSMSTLNTLMQSVSGMKVGLTLVKK